MNTPLYKPIDNGIYPQKTARGVFKVSNSHPLILQRVWKNLHARIMVTPVKTLCMPLILNKIFAMKINYLQPLLHQFLELLIKYSKENRKINRTFNTSCAKFKIFCLSFVLVNWNWTCPNSGMTGTLLSELDL